MEDDPPFNIKRDPRWTDSYWDYVRDLDGAARRSNFYMKPMPLWTHELIDWHEARMAELRYPPEIVEELRLARSRWLVKVKEQA